jgi:cell fate regulator YaaT (PSP1 superfamily)
MKPYIVGIRFNKIGKVYHFDSSKLREVDVGDFVIVETSRGRELGEVISIIKDPEPPHNSTWKPIYHKATPRDLVRRQFWQKKEHEALTICREKVAELRIEGVKIVAAEYSYDGSRVSFFYSTEAETKVNIRKLRGVMKRAFPRTRVEIRQIGPRDVAKVIGGMGACGLCDRCCSIFLTEFSPISIRMAKEQRVSLSPSEITGMCGRLRCCLLYEYQQYVEARKKMPKRKKRVVTPLGEGVVTDLYPLKEEVIVELETGKRHEFPYEDVQPWDELQALKKKAEAPCNDQKGKSGNCNKTQGDHKSIKRR